MNDRELLEFAAKAAGIKKPHMIDDSGFIYWHLGDRDCETCTVWNPLENDGDALRLAINLCLEIGINPGTKKTRGFIKTETLASSIGVTQPHDGDSLAATRRAIVRAA